MSEQYIDMDKVRNNPNKGWDLFWLSYNKQLTVRDVETLKLPNSKDMWYWFGISANINIQEVVNNSNKPWNKLGLSCNKQLTVKYVETLKLPNCIGDWHWKSMSFNININEVINNPNKSWDRHGLTLHIACTDKILEFFDAGLLKHLQRPISKFKYHTDIAIKCD